MKQSLILIMLNLSLLSISNVYCSKKNWLDEKPYQDVALPSTLRDLQALLDNSSLINTGKPALGEMASDGHLISEMDFQSASAYERNAYTWSNIDQYNAGWDGSNYVSIFYSNLVLETLDKISPANFEEQKQWDDIKGQALFLRSLCFYELAQIYGQPYVELTSSIDLGIPLRIESDINIRTTRTSVKETYDRIINDLLIAKALLPDFPTYKTRASKVSVFALLARIYLSIEKYQLANSEADSCLQLYNSLMNYNDNSNIVGTSYPIQKLNPETLYYCTLNNFATVGISLRIEPSFYTLYDSNDLRKLIFFALNSDSTISFVGNYSGNILRFCGLSVDEIYLIRAECQARQGNIEVAMNDLNTLLENRWKVGTFTPISATDPEDALKKVLEERKKELLLRGLRWSDLRRLNNDSRFATTLSRNVLGTLYKIEPNSFKYTFPIPQDVINATGIKQSPGW